MSQEEKMFQHANLESRSLLHSFPNSNNLALETTDDEEQDAVGKIKRLIDILQSVRLQLVDYVVRLVVMFSWD